MTLVLELNLYLIELILLFFNMVLSLEKYLIDIVLQHGTWSSKPSYVDVAQSGAKEPNLYRYGQVHMQVLFKANWAKEKSLEDNRFCRRSSRKQHILLTDSAGLGICKYLSADAW